jgi:hypothetical protein
MSKGLIAIAAAVLVVLTLSIAAMAEDLFVGTWRFNVAKSRVGTNPAPKSSTTKIVAVENGLKFEMDTVDADGKTTHSDGGWILDGKEHVDPANPSRARTCTRIDTYTIICVFKRDGKEIGTMEDVLSKDGKTGTMTTKGTNAKGEPVNTMAVWEKQ